MSSMKWPTPASRAPSSHGGARKWRTSSPVIRTTRSPADAILGRRAGEACWQLMAFETERAESFYDQAYAKLPAADRKSQRAGLIMAAIYRTLLAEIRRDRFRVLEQRIALTPLRKLWIAWKTWVAS